MGKNTIGSLLSSLSKAAGIADWKNKNNHSLRAWAITALANDPRNNANEVPRALLHLEKIRAASTAFMAYFCIPDRKKTVPRNSLAKIHTIAMQGMDFCKEVSQKRDSQKHVGLSLKDAWTKTLELPQDQASADNDGSLAKKAKLDQQPG